MSPLAYSHQRVQRLRRLATRASARRAQGCFVAEGAKVLAEALEARAPVESVYLDLSAGPPERELAARAAALGCRVFELSPGVLERISSTVTPQPVVAVVGRVDVSLKALGERRPDLVVVCVDLRDPGNAGTIVRSAEASGAGGVIFCAGSVDAFNPKTVRASAGAIFHVGVVLGGEPEAVVDEIGGWGMRRLGALARQGTDYCEADLVSPCALVVGNEAHGLPEAILERMDGRLSVPMEGRAESLNVGMATAVVCFEAARQRRLASAGRAR